MQNYWENELYETGSESSSFASDGQANSPIQVSSQPPPQPQISSGLKLKLPALTKPISTGPPKIILKLPKPPSNNFARNGLGNSNDIDYSKPSSSSAPLTPPQDNGLTLPLDDSISPVPLKTRKNKGPKAKFGFGRKDKGKQKDGPKAHRPQKLRPLKEVLQRLIGLIMKKDSYGFFLRPVDPAAVPGYSNIISNPMDFGTMDHKVSRGRYKSLEEFLSDFQLTLENAKSFNPAESLYHVEATRLLSWGIDTITKAAPTVLLHQMEWSFGNEDNIDVDIDGEGGSTRATSTIPDDSAMDTTESDALFAASLVNNGTGPTLRRGPRGAQKKPTKNEAESEPSMDNSIAADGRLPGSLEALGVFSPGSEWAKIMLDLKKRPYKYKTKKERMKVEREGPPLAVDGSRDIWRYEQYLTLLSDLIAEHDPVFHSTRTPHIVPLYRPLAPLAPRSPSQTRASTPILPQSTRASATPAPTQRPESLAPDEPIASSVKVPFYVSSNVNAPISRLIPPAQSTSGIKLPGGRRPSSHWILTRPTAAKRGRVDDHEPTEDTPPWKVPRIARARDWGSFSPLGSSSVPTPHPSLFPAPLAASEEDLDHALYSQGVRDSVDPTIIAAADPQVSLPSYWSLPRACEAEEYLRDLVYGGVDGFAYVQSLNQFLSPTNFPPDKDDPMVPIKLEESPPVVSSSAISSWIKESIVDSLTEGRHRLFREALATLAHPDNPASPTLVVEQVRRSLKAMPETLRSYLTLRSMENDKIDMGELIKSTEELWDSEELLRNFRTKYHSHSDDGDVKMADAAVLSHPESKEELQAALLDSGVGLASLVTEKLALKGVKKEDDEDVDMEPSEPYKAIRLNLLALAKRAPIDMISHFPKELVPEGYRHLIQ